MTAHANAPSADCRGRANDQVGTGFVAPIVATATHEIPDDTARCLVCHRPLTQPESVARGVGPHCLARLRHLTDTILAAGGQVIV